MLHSLKGINWSRVKKEWKKNEEEKEEEEGKIYKLGNLGQSWSLFFPSNPTTVHRTPKKLVDWLTAALEASIDIDHIYDQICSVSGRVSVEVWPHGLC